MGARFDRWLARPSTHRFLRQLTAPSERCYDCKRHLVSQRSLRYAATAAAVAPHGEEDVEIYNPRPRIRKTDDTKPSVVELLGTSTAEYGLRMSMRTGVPMLEAGIARESSFGELRIQADVNSAKLHGKLLVDQSEHRENFALWIELLRFRQRLDGLRGVQDVWYGMRRRHVDLPTSGEEAAVLWSEFTHAASPAGVENDTVRLYQEIFDHATDVKRRTGAHHEHLYKLMVGRLFRTHAVSAKYWHRSLSKAGMAPQDALKQVAIDAIYNRWSDGTYDSFRRLYHQSEERDLYDTAVREALRLRSITGALKWHRMCLKHGDFPSQETFRLPNVQKLFEFDKDAFLPAKKAAQIRSLESHATTKDITIGEYAPISRASMSTLVGDVHGIKAKEVSDTFVAKMFATRAFSLDLVIRGLGFFAIDKLGPLSVREMAVRAGSCVEFCNKLGDLKASDINLSEDAYCRLIQKIASDGQTDLYTALVSSDQHPETYEDTRTQEALLVQFLEAGDWAQAHVTMTGLSLTGGRFEGRAWNRLAQHYLRNRSWRAVERTMHSIQAQKVPLTSTTITYMHRYLLPDRRKRRRPVESQRRSRPPFNTTDFVANAYMYTEPLGRNVNYRLWIELLKRYGIQHRWAELERLVLWLGEQYSGHRYLERKLRRGKRVVVLRRSGPLREVFSDQMLQALFTWGFRSAAWKCQLRHAGPKDSEMAHERWAQGLVLIKRLRRYGVYARSLIIRRAFTTRMWILFGPGHSTKAFNELARQRNELRLGDYIQHGNEVWNGRLVSGITPELLQHDPTSEALLMLAFFGRYRKAFNSRKGVQEYVDVAAWADTMIAGRDLSKRRRKTVGQRQRTWLRSPYRVVRPKLLQENRTNSDTPVE